MGTELEGQDSLVADGPVSHGRVPAIRALPPETRLQFCEAFAPAIPDLALGR